MRARLFFRLLTAIGLAGLCGGLAVSQGRTAQSLWTPSPLQVDGLQAEWRGDVLLAEKKPGVSYGFKNDGRSLYVLVVFRNARSLEAFEATGMAIYYSPGGTREKANGTRFLKEDIPVDRFISLLESQGKVLTDEDKGFLRTRFQYPVFEAYAIDEKGKYTPAAGPASGAEPPVFRAANTEDGLTCEFRIPLMPRAPGPGGSGGEPGKTVMVGFEWGGSAMKVISTKASWHSPQSIVSGDVFSGSGETRAQEFLSSFDSLSRPLLKTKEYSFWVGVRLAPNP